MKNITEKQPKMKPKDKLKAFFENELKSEIASLETYRKESEKEKSKAIIATVVAVFLFVLFTWFHEFLGQFYIPFLIFVFFICLIIWGEFASVYQDYQKIFKQSVMQKLVAYINPDFSYSPNLYVDGKDFLDSKFTRRRCDLYFGDDYVSGTMDKTPFGFSDLVVKAVIWRRNRSYEENLKWIKELERLRAIYYGDYSEAEKNNLSKNSVDIRILLKIYTKVFKGLFFVAEFNKTLNDSTFVVAEKEYAILGRERSKVKNYGNLVKLENPEFEQVFSVYGSSQQEARYVITPTMMEAMLNLHKTYNLKMRFSFRGSKVYCAIPMRKSMFEPTIKRGVKYSDIEEFTMILNLIETIITEMNLNTRIWTKE